MRNLLFASFLASFIFFAPLAFGLQSIEGSTVRLDVSVTASPCKRNPDHCILIFVYPRAHIEVYRYGGEQVGSADTAESPDAEEDISFNLSAGEKYIFFIKNKVNGQQAVFGPMQIREDVRRMKIDFTMYNSNLVPKAILDDREICSKSEILEFSDHSGEPQLSLYPKMQCILDTFYTY
jgi:hypothetical protein